MNKVPQMVSMEIESDEVEQGSIPVDFPKPKFPYNLCISLCQREIDKLGVDISDWAVGDKFHLHALACITSISQRATDEGSDCRVELQIEELSGEDEDAENQQIEKQDMGFRPLG